MALEVSVCEPQIIYNELFVSNNQIQDFTINPKKGLRYICTFTMKGNSVQIGGANCKAATIEGWKDSVQSDVTFERTERS